MENSSVTLNYFLFILHELGDGTDARQRRQVVSQVARVRILR